jgi:hypothetical protein
VAADTKPAAEEAAHAVAGARLMLGAPGFHHSTAMASLGRALMCAQRGCSALLLAPSAS